MRRTKIVCTLGPSSESLAVIERLVAAGMDCARLNFSHGDHASHAEVAGFVRDASHRARRPVALLADLSGPKIRIGRFEHGAVQLVEGARFELTTRPCAGTRDRVFVNYSKLPDEVAAGDAILLDDGLLRLRVTDTRADAVETVVEVGGTLSDRKGANLPGAALSTPALTDKDERDLAFAVEEIGVDYLALSFVRRAEDVARAQALAQGTPVIAKIEKPEAVAALSAILDVADGLMVARGDLGVELGAEKVPLTQKHLIREANLRGKVVITATQMLDSMIRNPRPTRAEAADVANAVLDGTDALMLSGETAAGSFPIEAITMMDAIAREVETDYLDTQSAVALRDLKITQREEWRFPTAAARAAAVMSAYLPLSAIVTFTEDGESAGLIAEHRPKAPIVAITSRPEVARRLALQWGVLPQLEVPPDDLDEALRIATSTVVKLELCRKGDSFAVVVGWPPSGRTNTVKLHRV
ncbi:MAG: pyruvate kinase [Myxococcales bacterium]|nr:pyruvate kinase [Myxococcales bacterium]